MTCYVGLDVSQKMTAICVVNEVGHRLWRGQCRSVPSEIEASVRQHAGGDARIGLETGAMTPLLAHELRVVSLTSCARCTARPRRSQNADQQ